jgi:SAM-dependent methyltransferase
LDSIKESRINDEAQFQNSRILSDEPEARSKYYPLIKEAFKHYDDELEQVEGKKIVVVGCSDAGVIPLARKGADVIGVDVADQAVAKLNQDILTQHLSEKAKALVMDAEELTFEPNTIDMVVCSGVLHHLDVEKAIRTFKKVLKPNGTLVMMEPLEWSPAAYIYRKFTPSMRSEFEHPLVPRDFYLLERNFKEVRWSAYALTSCIFIPILVLPGMSRLKESAVELGGLIDRWLFKTFPSLKYFAWTSVIVCRK